MIKDLKHLLGKVEAKTLQLMFEDVKLSPAKARRQAWIDVLHLSPNHPWLDLYAIIAAYLALPVAIKIVEASNLIIIRWHRYRHHQPVNEPPYQQ